MMRHMKKSFLSIIILITTLHSNRALSFTLSPNTGKGFSKSNITINIASTSCSALGFSTEEFRSLIEDAVNHYWNSVPTSALHLKVGSIKDSIDISADDHAGALAKAQDNTVLAGCNTTGDDFSDPSILGAALMNCSGSKCKAVFLVNSSSTVLQKYSNDAKEAVIAHEIGHTIGLGHSEYKQSLMYYNASGKYQKWLGEDDITGISYLYPHESDMSCLIGSFGTIKMLGGDDDSDSGSFIGSLSLGVLLSLAIVFIQFVSSSYRQISFIKEKCRFLENS